MKKVPLDRLRDISKQRSIRTPLAQERVDRADGFQAEAPTLEWPISR